MRILIVDDNPDILELLEQALLRLGHEVLWAVDGEQAIGLLHWAEAVLTDLQMPGMNGVELARAIRRRHPQVPIVFSTGSDPTGGLARAAAGFGELLLKPWTFEDLRRAVDRLHTKR